MISVTAAQSAVDQLRKTVLESNTLDTLFNAGVTLQQTRTDILKTIASKEYYNDNTTLQGFVAMIGTLLDIWKDRKDLLVEKTKREENGAINFNKRFRELAKEKLNPMLYQDIYQKAQNVG